MNAEYAGLLLIPFSTFIETKNLYQLTFSSGWGNCTSKRNY
uniref:Hypertrehalosaemic hormone n=1 Tax=Spodoptera frugiperda TaxID=7108 RepID=A5PFK1_SPOFR|nr:hypertrehalosaemic hormone precursor [Spodoptera frugiperda]